MTITQPTQPAAMEPRNAIEIDDVVKEFRVYERTFATLKAQTMHLSRRLLHREGALRYTQRRALDHVSLNVPKGQTISLIGHNGSGKSTLLSILARIYLPTEGEVRIRGRVSSMLELGVGFNPELTGIENVFFSCAMRGMTRKQTEDRYEGIKAYAELDDHVMALPMRMYSSGMEARVAFSVAIHLDSDILLIDEGLAVGDAGFQEKCLNTLAEMKASGKTIFVVTHNNVFTHQFADRAVWLSAGRVHRDGAPGEVMDEYLEHMTGKPQPLHES